MLGGFKLDLMLFIWFWIWRGSAEVSQSTLEPYRPFFQAPVRPKLSVVLGPGYYCHPPHPFTEKAET